MFVVTARETPHKYTLAVGCTSCIYMYKNPNGSQSKLCWTALMRANKFETAVRITLFALVHLIFSCTCTCTSTHEYLGEKGF